MRDKVDYTAEGLLEGIAISSAIDQFLAARGLGRPASEALEELPQLVDVGVVLRGLCALEESWGTAPQALERDLRRRLEEQPQEPRRPFFWQVSLRPLAALALVAFATVGFLLTTPGHQALAALRAILQIGTVEVKVVPEGLVSPTPVLRTYAGLVEQEVADLEVARQMVNFPLREPEHLPPGYRLQRVTTISLEEGPIWLKEPFFVELYFAPDDASPELIYLKCRQSGVNPGEGWEVATFLFSSEEVKSVEQVDLNGKPAALLVIEGEMGGQLLSPMSRRPPPLRELLWQEESVMMELDTQVLNVEELVKVARSLQ